MNPMDPKDCDALDLRPIWREQYPSSGPAWDRAIEMGIDPAQLLHNLSLSVTERLIQLDEMTRLSERLHGTALAADAGASPASRYLVVAAELEAIREQRGAADPGGQRETAGAGPFITIPVGKSAANAVQLLTTDGWASGGYWPKPGKADVVTKLTLDAGVGAKVVEASRALTGA